MEHIVLKLVTAELVIGRLDSVTEDEFFLEHAMMVNYMSDPTTYKTSMYLTSLNPFNVHEHITGIPKKHIVFSSGVDKEIAEYYEQNVIKKLEREASAQLRQAANETLKNYERYANTTIN